MSTAIDVLRIAAKEIGYSRWDDTEAGTKYGRDFATRHGAYYGTSGVPYCAMFVTWVLRAAGMEPVGGDFAYVPYGINAAAKAGRLVPKHQAIPGDYLCFDWNNDSIADHVGFVEANRGSWVQTIEGNTSSGQAGSQSNGGGVYRRARNWDDVCAVIRPEYEHEYGQTPAGGVLDADGYWGEMTTRRLQEVLATPVDGIISDQDSAWQEANPALTSGWEWTPTPTEGSAVVEELQRRLGVDVDGLMGPDTINALETRLGFEADGHLDAPSPTVAALQQRLNRGEF